MSPSQLDRLTAHADLPFHHRHPNQDPGKAPLDLRFFELATAPPFSFIVEDVKVKQCLDLFVGGGCAYQA